MTDTPIVTAPTPPIDGISPATILQRIAPPFFSFSFVLFGALLVSQTFLLPKLTTFTVGGMDVSVDEALVYERQLRAEVISLEDKRDALVLPHIDATLDDLMKLKRSAPSVVDVQSSVQRAMQDVAAKAGATATVDAVLLENETKTVTVRGSVFDPNPSSMATLAAAVEAVRALPGVADVRGPALTREPADGGYRSPFRFTLTLK